MATPPNTTTLIVSVGEHKLMAIIDPQFQMNTIKKEVLEKICDKDRCKKAFEEPTIALDVTMEKLTVRTHFIVVSEIHDPFVDMILGKHFLQSAEGRSPEPRALIKYFRYSPREMGFRKLAKETVTATQKIKSDKEKLIDEIVAKFRASCEVSFEPTLPKLESPDKSERRKIRNAAKLAVLNLASSSSTSSSSSSSFTPKKEVVKMFIVERSLRDIRNGTCTTYYGVYCLSNNFLFLNGEKYNASQKSPLGLYLEALNCAFETAINRSITRLLIVTENGYAADMMMNRKRDYERGELECERPPFALNRRFDFDIFCNAFDKMRQFEFVEFECVPTSNENTYSELIYLRNIVLEYKEQNPK